MIEFKEFDESWNSSRGFDITPMLDMIFILLIFFLLTASAVSPVISVELPETEIIETSGEQNVVVSIDQNGGLFLNGEAVAEAELPGRLAAIYNSRVSESIYIESDKAVDFGIVVDVMDICRQSGARGISFLVDQKEKPSVK